MKRQILNESQLLKEGTSNFSHMGNLPLYVFYTYDEILYEMENDSDYPQEDDFYNEDGDLDYPAYERARDEFEQNYWDKIDVKVLDETEMMELDEAIDELNGELKDKADDLEGKAWELDNEENAQGLSMDEYNKLMDEAGLYQDLATFKVESGYYAGAQIGCKYPNSYDELDKEGQEFVLGKLKEIGKRFGLTQLGVSYRFSNGETGYHKVEESVEDNELTPYLDIELEDDGSPYGGIEYEGETVRDFLEYDEEGKITTLAQLNKELKSCGIKPIKPLKEAVDGTPHKDDYAKAVKRHKASNKKGSINNLFQLGGDPKKSMEKFNHMNDVTPNTATTGETGGEACCEGAEGKKVEGKEYVIYRTDLEDEQKAPIIAIRKTRTEAESVARFNKKYPSLNYDEVPKGKFKVGDDFYGPFDDEWNKNESLNEAKDDERVAHYQGELDKLGATEEECNKYIKIADDYEEKASKGFISYNQMDEVANAMGLKDMTDNELARAWEVCYYTLSREAFREDDPVHYISRYEKYGDAASAFSEVINMEARARKEKGNFAPKKGEAFDLEEIVGKDYSCDTEGLLYLTRDAMRRIVGEAKDRGMSFDELMKMSIAKEDSNGRYGSLVLDMYENTFKNLWEEK